MRAPIPNAAFLAGWSCLALCSAWPAAAFSGPTEATDAEAGELGALFENSQSFAARGQPLVSATEAFLGTLHPRLRERLSSSPGVPAEKVPIETSRPSLRAGGFFSGEASRGDRPRFRAETRDLELARTYEEFCRDSEERGLRKWLKDLARILMLPVELFKQIHSEILARRGESWDEFSRRLEDEVSRALAWAGPASFENPEFVRSFEKALGTEFFPGNRVTPLIDGPASFAERFARIDEARRTIHLMTWAIYDDETGFLSAQKLIRKAREGVKVRIIVDEQMSLRPHHGLKILPYLEAAGIPVVRWRSGESGRRYDGQHRKIMIVDSRAAIAGGMNVGDHYSHLGPDSEKWSDIDLLLEGPAAVESERLFVRTWNAQIDRLEASLARDPSARERIGAAGYERLAEPEAPLRLEAGPRVALIDHVPGSNDNGPRSVLLAAEAARTSLDIENCYFILTPALLRALDRARARGVRIRILTNSAESIDEPVVTYPILKSAESLRERGVEIYLKKGSLLHTKLMIVDDAYAWVGSYNFQPRSDRMEREVLYGVLDKDFVSALRRSFESEVGKAGAAHGPIEMPFSIFSRLAYFLFYNQL